MTHDDASTGTDAAYGGMRASEVLEARLVPGPRAPLRSLLRGIGALWLAAVGGDGSDLGAESFLVLRRIDTGEEVLRMDAGTLLDADLLLQRIRLELTTLPLAVFAERWPIRPSRSR